MKKSEWRGVSSKLLWRSQSNSWSGSQSQQGRVVSTVSLSQGDSVSKWPPPCWIQHSHVLLTWTGASGGMLPFPLGHLAFLSATSLADSPKPSERPKAMSHCQSCEGSPGEHLQSYTQSGPGPGTARSPSPSSALLTSQRSHGGCKQGCSQGDVSAIFLQRFTNTSAIVKWRQIILQSVSLTMSVVLSSSSATMWESHG